MEGVDLPPELTPRLGRSNLIETPPEDHASYACTASAGWVWPIELVADDHNDHQCLESGELKPRRGVPQIRVSQFLEGLENRDGDFVFAGEINGWGGLRELQLQRVSSKGQSQSFIEQTGAMFGRLVNPSEWLSASADTVWEAESAEHPAEAVQALSNKLPRIRVMMTQPAWSRKGWSSGSPGFAFWVSKQQDGTLRVFHGQNMEAMAREDRMTDIPDVCSSQAEAVVVHHIVHRYYVPNESIQDKFTYHAIVLLEWSHGKFCTVLELGFRNGLGGYGGKSNWYDDRNEKPTALYTAMPASLKLPWDEDHAEIRVSDVEAQNLEEFKEYLTKYTGERFLNPQVVESAAVRLAYRKQPDIMRYLLNYIGADDTYTEMSYNCQAFVADFYGFLTAKKDQKPFHEIHVPYYTNRTHLFLYDPDV